MRGHTRRKERDVVEGEGKGEGHPRREEHNPRVMFFVSGVVEGEGTPQTRRTRPQGHVLRVWVVEGEGKGEGHPRREEHDPGVAFFIYGVVDSEGTPQTRRTRPQGSCTLCLGGRG